MQAIIATLYFLTTVVVLGLIGGWFANICKLAGLVYAHGEISGILVARAIGVVIPFLGAILGFF